MTRTRRPAYGDELHALAERAWRLHRRATEDGAVRVTRPSAPILYFGDVLAYRSSPLRVVTVGVNPSGEEFPPGDSWSRFPCGHLASTPVVSPASASAYLETLDQYFRGRPYDRWFRRGYEPVLHGMEAGYYGDRRSTAIHTDICSPLATTPTWRHLSRDEQEEFAIDGAQLWHDLIHALAPDVILASISRRHLARIRLSRASASEVIHTVPQKRPCLVFACKVACGGRRALLVWGAAATTPFQMISDAHKQTVGSTARARAHD